MENKYSNKYIIETGIGLQDVDGLKNSTYFINESEKYIRGEITLDELEEVITSYYKNRPEEKDRTEEADIVSTRIAKIISDDSFSFTVGQLISIHKQLFEGVFTHAGKLRTYNFTKKEWVLDGASVLYSDYRLIETTLQYDFDKRFNYTHLSTDEIINHLAIFISNIWQIHAFEEGNTRTTAVFTIKYLRSLGYDVTNDSFAKNAWYFRNALVRANANYKHLRKGIYEDRTFIIMFLRNLILGEKNQLHNRDLHVSPKQEPQEMSREDRIIDQINTNPSIKLEEIAQALNVSLRTIKLEEIAQALNVSLRTIKNAVASLVKNNKIERVGGKKAGYWKIKH